LSSGASPRQQINPYPFTTMILNKTTEQNESQPDDDRLSDVLHEVISKNPAWILRNATGMVAASFILIVGWTWNIRYTERIRTPITIISSAKLVIVDIKANDTGGFSFSEGQRIIVRVPDDSTGTPRTFDGRVVRIIQISNSAYKVLVTLLNDRPTFHQNNMVIEAEIISKDRRLLEKLLLILF
jgi:hypothetical protein